MPSKTSSKTDESTAVRIQLPTPFRTPGFFQSSIYIDSLQYSGDFRNGIVLLQCLPTNEDTDSGFKVDFLACAESQPVPDLFWDCDLASIGESGFHTFMI